MDTRLCVAWALVAFLPAIAKSGDLPATNPSTRPSNESQADKTASGDLLNLRKAKTTLDKAKADCLKKLSSDSRYKSEVSLSNDALRNLQAAREGMDAQAKLNASSLYSRSVGAVRKMESESLSADPAVKAAVASVADCQAKENLDANERRMENDAAAKAIADDPIEKAVKEGRIVRGMTVAQAKGVLANYSLTSFTDNGNVKWYTWELAGKQFDVEFTDGKITSFTVSSN